jgi:hypothetical protein
MMRARFVAAASRSSRAMRRPPTRAPTRPRTVSSRHAGAGAADLRRRARAWHGADDINGWIGAHFAYDARARDAALGDAARSERLAIHRPDAFYAIRPA